MNDKLVIVSVLAISIAMLTGAWYMNVSRGSQVSSAANAIPDVTEAPAQLNSIDTVVGTGRTAEVGDTVFVHYTGRLTDGTIFDSSIPRNEPFSFQLGMGHVIQGWEIGIQGMKVGGKRTLTIPPELGYGAQAVGTIPANSTLVFEVELIDVKDSK